MSIKIKRIARFFLKQWWLIIILFLFHASVGKSQTFTGPPPPPTSQTIVTLTITEGPAQLQPLAPVTSAVSGGAPAITSGGGGGGAPKFVAPSHFLPQPTPLVPPPSVLPPPSTTFEEKGSGRAAAPDTMCEVVIQNKKNAPKKIFDPRFETRYALCLLKNDPSLEASENKRLSALSEKLAELEKKASLKDNDEDKKALEEINKTLEKIQNIADRKNAKTLQQDLKKMQKNNQLTDGDKKTFEKLFKQLKTLGKKKRLNPRDKNFLDKLEQEIKKFKKNAGQKKNINISVRSETEADLAAESMAESAQALPLYEEEYFSKADPEEIRHFLHSAEAILKETEAPNNAEIATTVLLALSIALLITLKKQKV